MTKMRGLVSFALALVLSLASWAVATGQEIHLQQQPPRPPPPRDYEFQGRVDNISSWGTVLSTALDWLNDKGFEKVVGRSLDAAGPELRNIFDWAAPPGVLIQVVVQVPIQQPEGKTYRELVGDKPLIIGAGTTPYVAFANSLAFDQEKDGAWKAGSPHDGWVISTEWSRYFWISKDRSGFALQRYGYVNVTTQGGALFANKQLLSKLSLAQGSSMISNMLNKAIKDEKDAEARKTMAALQKSAQDSLKRLDEINKQLSDALEAAAKVQKLANTLSAIGGALTLASKIGMAKAALGNDTPADILSAKSQAELDQAIDNAEKNGRETTEVLQKTKTTEDNNYIYHKQEIIIRLKDRGAPTYILP
jgi:hypothetical protein